MVVRLVKFKSALSDPEVMKHYDERAARYREVPGLLQKYDIKDLETDEHGAVDLWDSMKSMRDFEGSELSRSLPKTYKIIGQARVEVYDIVYTLRPEERE